MKKSKANIIGTVICIVVTLALVGLAVFGIVKNNIEKEREAALNEYQQAQQTDNHEHETTDNHDTDNTTETTELAETIPNIKDDPQLPDVQGQPSIDVGEMTKNPEAEVVDSKIEYGTKEGGTNVE